MNGQNPSSTSTGRSRRWTIATLLLLVILVVCSLPLLVLQIASTWVAGQEFSPHTFDRRNFRYLQIPGVQWQISGVYRETRTGALEKYLTRKNYVAPAGKAPARWDLVYDSVTPAESAACDAAILCRYLDSRDANRELTWLTWTQKHPALAKVLWKKIGELAVDGRYVFMPPLFQLSMQATDPHALQQQMNRLVAGRYAGLALAKQALQQHRQAVKHFDAALQYVPDHAAALEGRALSLQALSPKQPLPEAPPGKTQPEDRIKLPAAGPQGPP